DKEIAAYQRGIVVLGVSLFLGVSLIVALFLIRSVNRPIRRLITETRRIANGEYDFKIDLTRDDDIGEMARAIHKMREEIRRKQEELKQNWHEYQNLFEESPCYITVQDRNLRILRYNREFEKRFYPNPGDYCYTAYKGRSEKCEVCPVMKTFEDGEPHISEETARNKDGTESYWTVRSSPIKNTKGEVVAAMEMSLDLTHVKLLEREAQKSEEKYRIIFDTIPNPLFVLDAESLKILDCNDSVTAVYGFTKQEVLLKSFPDLFEPSDREEVTPMIKSSNVIERTRQIHKDGNIIYVTIRVSSSEEYADQPVLLVITSDITMRLMAEQQLIQSSKMATLGEMATSVAHELNQPLSVIKTASSFIKRKVTRGEPIAEESLKTMAEEMDSHVDRAEKIIQHMREFGRKADVAKAKVQVNEVLKRALDLFKQQLKLRGIEVEAKLQEDLPLILAEENRLEQVFVNLLINARDAVEKKWEKGGPKDEKKRITLLTTLEPGGVAIRVGDNGTGIPAAILDKIFEPFFTTKRVGKGTGLGLSISYGIVRDYDGAIEVITKEGGGSTFVIRFPLPEEA
ncbi:MAG: PAS domain S-box protein, partial [Pseudomonadota bacterium]